MSEKTEYNRQTLHGLQERQRIAKFIVEYIEKFGYSPTYKEIMKECEIKSTSVAAYHIYKMVNAGIMTMVGGSSRTIRPTDKTDEFLAVKL